MITGGTAGVGRAVGDLYARRRWRVGLIARGTERLDQASQALRSLGAEQTASVSADVADAAAVERAADIIEQELRPIAVWINCAMVTIYAPFSAIEPSEFERVTRVVYLGAVNGTRAALTRMRGRAAVPSSAWDPRWPIGRSHCSPPIAAPSRPARLSRIATQRAFA